IPRRMAFYGMDAEDIFDSIEAEFYPESQGHWAQALRYMPWDTWAFRMKVMSAHLSGYGENLTPKDFFGWMALYGAYQSAIELGELNRKKLFQSFPDEASQAKAKQLIDEIKLGKETVDILSFDFRQ